MDTINQQLHAFLARSFPKLSLADDQNLFQLGFVNSLFAIQLISFVENEFGLELNDDDLDLTHFSTIQSIEALILHKRGFDI